MGRALLPERFLEGDFGPGNLADKKIGKKLKISVLVKIQLRRFEKVEENLDVVQD